MLELTQTLHWSWPTFFSLSELCVLFTNAHTQQGCYVNVILLQWTWKDSKGWRVLLRSFLLYSVNRNILWYTIPFLLEYIEMPIVLNGVDQKNAGVCYTCLQAWCFNTIDFFILYSFSLSIICSLHWRSHKMCWAKQKTHYRVNSRLCSQERMEYFWDGKQTP